jgi:hypothetical protein
VARPPLLAGGEGKHSIAGDLFASIRFASGAVANFIICVLDKAWIAEHLVMARAQ